MKAFRYVRPNDVAGAAKHGASADALMKAGGIDVLDRMKERVDEPDRVVALLSLGDPALRAITKDGATLRIGALATLSDVAASDLVRAHAAPLAQAAGMAASLQIRNRATVAGNLLQRTRCGYFRIRSFPCWRRGDDACPVLADGAVQETAGIFGNSQCASAHPASLPPVFGALGATVHVRRANAATDDLPFGELYVPPRKGRHSDASLEPGDIVTALSLPVLTGSDAAAYEEVRQKAAFDWALVSAAVKVSWNGEVFGKRVAEKVSVWLGSVAPTPYRAAAAEAAILNKQLTDGVITKASEAAASGAKPLDGTKYKVHLVKVAVRRALLSAAGRAE